MIIKAKKMLLVTLAILLAVLCGSSNAATTKSPNVLVLFVDDLGYGDLGSYGNATIPSRNIDERIAAKGTLFTQWLSAAPICTPSRGSLLTGRLPVRIGLAAKNFHRRVFGPISIGGLPHSELTLAEALKERGYKTHMTGKWHLVSFFLVSLINFITTS